MRRLHAIVLVAGCLLIMHSSAKPQRCCGDGLHILADTNICEDGKKVAVDCDENMESVPRQEYALKDDSEGEYLDAYHRGFMVRELGFCEGTLADINRIDISLICHTAKIMVPKAEAVTSSRGSDFINTFNQIWQIFYKFAFLIFNTISFLLLIITAFLYRSIREVQDAEGTCIFHMSLNLAILHLADAFVFYYYYSTPFCTINLFVEKFTELITYMWAIILLMSMWNTLRKNQPASKLSILYGCLAYVLPIIILGISTLVILSPHWSIYKHLDYCIMQRVVVEIFMQISIFVTVITIGFFYISLRQKILHEENSFLRKARYRLLLFGKLFIILGVPRVILLIISYTSENMTVPKFLYSMLSILQQIFDVVFLIEGLFVFLLLVIGRPRMRQAIARGYCANNKLIPDRWRTEEDPEDVPENVDLDMFNQRQTPVDYTPKERYGV